MHIAHVRLPSSRFCRLGARNLSLLWTPRWSEVELRQVERGTGVFIVNVHCKVNSNAYSFSCIFENKFDIFQLTCIF